MSRRIYLFYSEFRETQRIWRSVPDLLFAICDRSVLTGFCLLHMLRKETFGGISNCCKEIHLVPGKAVFEKREEKKKKKETITS